MILNGGSSIHSSSTRFGVPFLRSSTCCSFVSSLSLLDTLATHDRYPSSSSFVIMMGKGDGKKKRKKKSSGASTAPTPSSSASPPPPPQRVSNLINVPVRRQIKYGKMRKEAMKMSGTSFRADNVKKTSYRKNLDEEEISAARTLRQSLAKEPDWEAILNNTSSSPLVIVDAYNVIHQWPRLKKWMTKGLLHRAREKLLFDLEELRVLKGWRVEVVFDSGGGSSTTATGVPITSTKVTNHGVRVVYAPSADGYVEGRCAQAERVTGGRYVRNFIVVSDDQMIRTAASSAGAMLMGSGRLVDELKTVKKMARWRLEHALAQSNNNNGMVPMVPMRHDTTKNHVTNPLYGRRQVILEDKRERRNKNRNSTNNTSKAAELKDVIQGTKSTPSWALVPNTTNTSVTTSTAT